MLILILYKYFLMNEKSIFETLLSNGAVVLAFLGLIGYFIKRIFDLKTKKVEIKYSLYHQNKLKYMAEFQASYLKLYKTFDKYTDKVLEKEKLTSDDLEKIQSEFDRFSSAHENVFFFVPKYYRDNFIGLGTILLPNFIWRLIEFNKDMENFTLEEFKTNSEFLNDFMGSLFGEKGTWGTFFEELIQEYRAEFNKKEKSKKTWKFVHKQMEKQKKYEESVKNDSSEVG